MHSPTWSGPEGSSHNEFASGRPAPTALPTPQNPFPISLSSPMVSFMRLRRKSEIRAAARRRDRAFAELRDARAAFLRPRPRSWHDVVLARLREGESVASAARAAGVSKSGVYWARDHEPGFAAAFVAAMREGLALRRGQTTGRRETTAGREIGRSRHSQLGPAKLHPKQEAAGCGPAIIAVSPFDNRPGAD